MTDEFSGNAALIVGRTSGIGEAAVEMFAAHECQVVFAGIGSADGSILGRRINATDRGRALFVETDVRSVNGGAKPGQRGGVKPGQCARLLGSL